MCFLRDEKDILWGFAWTGLRVFGEAGEQRAAEGGLLAKAL